MDQQEIIKNLQALLESLNINPQGGVDEKQLREEVEKAMKGYKVQKSNLSADVIEMLESVQRIEIKVPNMAKAVSAPEANNIPAFLKIIDDVLVNNNVFLVGEAGTGKTTIAKAVARVLGRKVMTINCNQWTSPGEIVGGETIEGYKDGKLIKAWEQGMLLVLDELPKLDPNTAGVLNEALAESDQPEGTEIIAPNGRRVKKHKDFAVIATGNTTGKGNSARYSGNNKQDLSLIDRFSGNYYQIEFNKDLERSLVHSTVFDICDKIRDQVIATNADEIMTLRTMLQMNKIYQLEMLRDIGEVPRVNGGKTLADSVDSYLAVMNKDKAILIKGNINYNTWKNSYRDRAKFQEEWAMIDPKKRKAVSAKATANG